MAGPSPHVRAASPITRGMRPLTSEDTSLTAMTVPLFPGISSYIWALEN